MATYIVGQRKPARLGKNYVAPQQPVNPNAMFYVVNRNAALMLQGSKTMLSKNVTCYAVFNSAAKAEQYLKETRRNLIACVVEL